MNDLIKEQRSGVANENLQEMLDAEANVNNLGMTGAAQYFSPPQLASYCTSMLPSRNPATVIDPQCGEGALLKAVCGWSTHRFGVDIDNRLEVLGSQHRFVNGNCVKFAEALDDIYPGTVWTCGVANPPFGKRWKLADGSAIDSTRFTWEWLLRHTHYGYMIASAKTIEALGIHTHSFTYKYETRPASEYWDGVDIVIGIVWYKHPNPQPATDLGQMFLRFDKLREVLDEERNSRPDFNIYLNERGYLRTYLSTRSEIKLNLTYQDRGRLFRVDKSHPLSLTTEKETRDLLRELIDKGVYTIQPEAKAAIESALVEVNALACPIMPVTPFESVAYADEEEMLTCTHTINTPQMQFTAGRKYAIFTGSYKFAHEFKRNKLHFNEKSLASYKVEHDCVQYGQDRYIAVSDDHRRRLRFMERPMNDRFDFKEELLWTIFDQPKVSTIAETKPAIIRQNEAVLRSCEMLAGFEYYPGQRSYLARVAAKDQALVAAATGTGKTLMAISLLAQKAPERALIIAPQGTMRSTGDDMDDDDEDGEQMMNASQWIQEITRFAPYLQIWELFSHADYERICSQNGGKLPPGVFVTYYQAFFQNGARETAAQSWDDEKLNKMLVSMGARALPKPEGIGAGKRFWCDSIGKEKDGIRCIMQPCLSTLIGHLFDFVAVDEAHICTNLGANVTQMLVRLQPKYRYAFTATPIPNIVSNLFSLMGWLAVPDWYKGGRRNAAWPYSREEIGRFNGTFLTQERDLTQEDLNRQRDPKWDGKCIKVSPVIASPARLLKLLKPTMCYISKQDCNPRYIEPTIIDVRVPLGHDQARLYAHFLDRANIPASHPLVRARKQVAWLRAITADPMHFKHSPEDLKVKSNMNPKVISILELCREILAQGEQVVIINSRIGLTDTIQEKLVDAGISVARIDSTIPADEHARQANIFKARKAMVMLMGIKCAASHSFDQCRFEIIGSIEYSPGPFNQAKGRVDRVNSRPDVRIYCILTKGTIEEVMFDLVATKDDAATICLKGQRVPREFKPVDAAEIMATAVDAFDMSGSTPETKCEQKWPDLCTAIAKTRNVIPVLTR